MKSFFVLLALACTAMSGAASAATDIVFSLEDENTVGKVVNLIEDPLAKTMWVVTHVDHSRIAIDQLSLAGEEECPARQPALLIEVLAKNLVEIKVAEDAPETACAILKTNF